MNLTITNLGPHADLRLDMPAHAIVRGPSQAGKSSLLHGLCVLLGGTAIDGSTFPTELIRDDCDAAHVELGDILRRRISRTGSKRGHVGQTAANSGRAWAEALGHVGEHWTEIGLHIVSPMTWQTLASTTRARGLSGLLRAVLPPVDMRAMLAQDMTEHGGMRDTDPIHLTGAGGALSLQRSANSAADQAIGRVDQCAADLARLEGQPAQDRPTAPPAGRVEKARLYLATLSQWQAYDDAVASRQREIDAGESGRLALRRWHDAVAELGEQPAHPGDQPTSDAPETLRSVETERADLLRQIQDAKRAGETALRSARRAVHEWRQTEPAQECAECGQALPSAEEATARWQARLAELGEAVTAAEKADNGIPALYAAVNDIDGRLREARAAAQAHADSVATWQAALDKHTAWQRQRATLDSTRPPEPSPVSPEPQKPNAARPPAGYAENARQLIEAHDRHAADLAAWERAEQDRLERIETARASLEAAQGNAAELRAEADRVRHLCAALRTVPGRAAASQASALDEQLRGTGVSVHWADPDATTGPEVWVHVDGRPWVCASDGRRVLADLALRLALRRLAHARYGREANGIPYAALPIVVDRAQAWSGGWPPARLLGGPVWRLETVAGLDAVEVSAW